MATAWVSTRLLGPRVTLLLGLLALLAFAAIGIHVGLQIGSRPEGLVPGDAPSARWEVDVRVIELDDERDFRGPAVHGKRGERFLYLTWGEYDGREFAMFREPRSTAST